MPRGTSDPAKSLISRVSLRRYSNCQSENSPGPGDDETDDEEDVQPGRIHRMIDILKRDAEPDIALRPAPGSDR